MTARTVSEELRFLHGRIEEVRTTPCRSCGHPFSHHHRRTNRSESLWCFHRSYSGSIFDEDQPKPVDCRCKAFVDPSEVFAVLGESCPTQTAAQ